MLRLTGVTKVFMGNTPNEVTALSHIDLSLEKGDFVTVIGSNGAGKSTLLNAIMGLCTADSGTIELDGENLTAWPAHERAKYIGRIAQDSSASTCSVMTIEENMAMAALRGQRRGLRMAVNSSNRARFRELLFSLGLGLEDRLSSRVSTLSGGQRQALAVLMATLADQRLLLLDEHIAALDPKTAEQVMQITNHFIVEGHLTTLMVTHNMAEAIRWGDRLIMMHKGRIVVDISGQEKHALAISDLTRRFHDVCEEEFTVDRMVLAV